MPNMFRAKFRYFDKAIELTPPGDLSIASYVFSANGLYLPDLASNHQPRGFDQMMDLYDQYTVLKSYITVSFSGRGTIDEDTTIIGLSLEQGSTALTSSADYIESGAKWTLMPPPGLGGGIRTLKSKANTNRFLGISKPLANSDVKGTQTSNPTEQCYWHVFLHDQSTTGASAGQITLSVKLTYIAMLHEPKTPAESTL